MPAGNKWRQCQSCRIAVAIWNYSAQSDCHLSLSVGDTVCVLEEYQGWYRGYLYLYPSKNGIFPASFVAKKSYSVISAGEEDYPVPKVDPVALEATECLHQWKKQLFKLYSDGNKQKYMQLLNYMEDVFHWRGTIAHSNVTHENLIDMRTKLTAKIDQINNMCSLPMCPRDTQGQPINPCITSVQDIYTTHKIRRDEVVRRVPQTGWDQKKTKEPTASKAYHLYLVVRNIEHHFPEDCEVFMFLFDSEAKKRVSENFLINVKKSAVASSNPSRHYCIFSDLGAKEMNQCSLYLVCQVVRKGKMLLDDKKHISSYPFRRPYAVGVLDLRQAVLEATSEKPDETDDDDYQMTYLMTLHVCTTHEADFSTLHLSLIKKLGVKASDKKGITVSTAIKIIKGDLQKLKKDLAYMINKSTVTVDKMGFPDVIFPDDVRNDIYVTLEHGQFEKGNKTAPRNVEVAIAICDTKGQIVPHCIVLAAGAAPLSEYESFIYYHLNQPKWHETFKLAIPSNKINVAHLRLGFRHVAKSEGKDKMEKTFAFSYIKLMKEDGSIIPDGTHELFVYKAEAKKWLDPSFYLKIKSAREVGGKLPSMKEKTSTRGKLSTISVEGTGSQSISYSGKETVYISTLICSTKLTQKVELVSLLNWKNAHPKSHYLPTILMNIKYIDGEEIVKFLPDILNCLFDILAEDARTYGEHVFNALMSVFGIFSDDKFKHFIPVLDIYIENHFHSIATHKDLLKFLNRLLKSIDPNYDKQQELLGVINSLKFLMKFIIQSYILENSNYDDFRKILHDFYDSMSLLLSTQESYYRGIHTVQIALLENLPAVLDDITKMHNATRLAQIFGKLIDSIQNTHPLIMGEKMTFINALLDSDANLLRTPDARKALIPTIVSHLISYIDNKLPGTQYRSDDKGNQGCLKAIGKLLKVLHNGESLKVDFEDIDCATKLFPNLVGLCKELLGTSNPLKSDALINLIGLFRVMTDNHFSRYFNIIKLNCDSPGHDNDLKNAVTDILSTINLVINNPAFPKDWVVLYHIQSSTLLRVLKNVSSSLFSSFFDDRAFIPSIWDSFFEVCVIFSTQSCLQLEQYPDLIKAKLIREFGDIRSQMCQYTVELWHKLGPKKGNFIPNMIGPFLRISLLQEKEIQRVSIPIVIDFMKYEQETSHNFKRVETEVFDKMDIFVSGGQGDEAYRDLFREILIPLCKADNAIGEPGSLFIDSVTHLIGLLLDYRNVQGDSFHKGQRMGCMFNLLNFYKEIEKEELYIRYVYRLSDLHERDSNFTEAALTLLLHADTLEWCSEDSIPQEGRFPLETAHQRKERLYQKAIKLLDQGKNWELGIPLCKSIADVYEKKTFDYQKLSEILQTQASFFLKVITELRVEDEYFVVGYYGKGSPLFLRNKTYIHRGQPYERLQAFIKRLTDEFPLAKILMSAEPPDSDVRNSNGLFLQVRKVIPIPQDHHHVSEAAHSIPDKILDYYKTNKVSKFRYDRPFHKGKKDPECEFATLFIERTTFGTESEFPGVTNAFEVNKTSVEEVNPLDIATETVSSKVKEIQKVISDITADPSLNINPLSMLLKGVIDAAVMGGISNYEKIFFQPKYKKEHPDHAEQVDHLRDLIKDQVEVLRDGLALHCQRVSKDLMAFHCDLEERFEGFQDIVFPDRKKGNNVSKTRSMSISRPLPPTPNDTRGGITRRATGIKSSMTIDQPGGDQPLKRSLTTRLKPGESRLSMVSEDQSKEDKKRSSILSTTRNTSYRDSTISSGYGGTDPDERDNYEMMDFDFDKKKPAMLGSSAPPPSYAAPPAPPKSSQKPSDDKDGHNYFEIDYADNEDDDDYQPVIPGQNRPGFRGEKTSTGSTHKSEFADPRDIIPLNKREKSPSDSVSSPPRRNSFIEKLRSRSNSSSRSSPQATMPPPQPSSPPPSPPNTTHLTPSGLSKKSPSPGQSSDSEPILEDLNSIRKRLLQQARDSVAMETQQQPPLDNSKPLIDFTDTGISNVAVNPTPSFVNQQPLPPRIQQPPVQQQDDYWDHLEVQKSMSETIKSPNIPIQPKNNKRSPTQDDMYSLATDWQPVDTFLPPVQVSGMNSMYSTVDEAIDDGFRPDNNRSRMQPPPKPTPYSRSPSHSPPPPSVIKSPPPTKPPVKTPSPVKSQPDPPPLPKKRKGNTPSVSGTSDSPSRPGNYIDFPNSKPVVPNNQETTKPPLRPSTERTLPSSGQPPIQRRPLLSASDTDSTPKKSFNTPPVLPPKPGKPDVPVKGPVLPPKPATRPTQPAVSTSPKVEGPPVIPPRPVKPPVPNRH